MAPAVPVVPVVYGPSLRYFASLRSAPILLLSPLKIRSKMTRTNTGMVVAVVLAGLVGNVAAAQAKHNCGQVTSGVCVTDSFELPTSVKEFIALRAKWKKDPWNGARLFITAMLVRQINKPLGQKLLVLAVDRDEQLVRGKWFKGYMMRQSSLRSSKPWCMRALVKGTSPRRGYAFDPKRVRIQFNTKGTTRRGRVTKVFVYSSGAGKALPMWVKQDSKGRWKLSNWSWFVNPTQGYCRRPSVAWDPKRPAFAPAVKNPDDEL